MSILLMLSLNRFCIIDGQVCDDMTWVGFVAGSNNSIPQSRLTRRLAYDRSNHGGYMVDAGHL